MTENSICVEFNGKEYTFTPPTNIPFPVKIVRPVTLILTYELGITYFSHVMPWSPVQQTMIQEWLENKPYGVQLLIFKNLCTDLTLLVQPKEDLTIWGKIRDYKVSQEWWTEICQHLGLKGKYNFTKEMKMKDRLEPRCPDCGMKVSKPKSVTKL